MSDTLIIVGVVVVIYAVAAERVARSMVTGPMIFTAIGLAIGPKGLDLIDLPLAASSIDDLLNATLAVVLFVDAAHINVRALRRSASTPTRLLVIGFPAMLVLGSLAGSLVFPAISFVAVLAIATILAPTDAALGQAVITNPTVPIGVRQSLSVESGLNDGLALPVLFTVLAIGQAEESDDPWRVLLEHIIEELGWGLVAGIGVGVFAVVAIRLAFRVGLAPSATAVGLATMGALAATVGVAQVLHGSQLIAAFIAGIVIGPTISSLGENAYSFGENASEILTLLAFVVFGAVIVSDQLDTLTWQIALYAVLSLAVLRPLTVWIATLGSGYNLASVGFMGWFGPRGLASILFVTTIVADSPEFQDLETVTAVMTWTVLLSVIAHGLSAWPASNRFAAFCEAHPDKMDESPAMTPLPTEVLMGRVGSVTGRHSPEHHEDRGDGG
ncbi:MAG: cation:proton antiporter [Acidimicrobiia bacterium]|nr:cation:proton antiporter [Acidimicrobiia bacterium]